MALNAKRIANHITNKSDLEFLLNIKEEDITYSFLMELFGEFEGKRRFNTYDIMSVPPGYYGSEKNKNTNTFTTTIGKWVFNKYFIEKNWFDILGYVNKPMNKKLYGSINKSMSYAILEDKAPIEALKDYIMKCQHLQPFVAVYSPSYSLDMLLVTKEVNKKKKELLDLYKDDLKNDDLKVKTIDKIQKELLDYVDKDLLKDDPAMDVFRSGARGSFENNFKNLYIMRGAVKDPDPTKGYNIITSSFSDGINKDEYSAFANSLAAGPYARAKKTEVGGYWEKLGLNSYMHVKLDPHGSDCGTERTITVNVTEKNISEIMYCYVKQGSRLIEITSENKDSFIGKKVQLRFSSMCESKTGICNKCAGELFYKLGIENIGTAIPQVFSTLKVLQLKGFHDAQIRLHEMDPMRAFGLE